MIALACLYGQISGQQWEKGVCDNMSGHTPRNIQSPYTANDFWTQHDSVNPRMVVFVKITPQSFWTGVSALGFTSNTRNMTLPGHPGITFYSTPGLSPSAVEQGLGESTNLEMMGVYQSGLFTHADIMAGKWDYAEYEVFCASWQNTSLGELVEAKGNLSDFKDYQTFFNGEGRGLIARYSNEVNKVTQRLCRVKDFRDAECGHTASTVTIGANTYDIEQSLRAADTLTPAQQTDIPAYSSDITGTLPPEGFYNNGAMTFTSGSNTGITREIAFSTAPFGGLMSLNPKRAFPYTIETDDTFDLVAGCTRTPEDCKKFTNIENFRGEPFIPGIETANRPR